MSLLYVAAVFFAVPVGAALGLVIAAKMYDFGEDYQRVRSRKVNR